MSHPQSQPAQPNANEIPSNAQPTQPAYLRDGLIHRKQAVYRLDGADIRWYYTISDHGQVRFYGSVTSILDKTLPTSPYLIKWIADHGVQGAARLRDQKAEYGTLMHLVIADYLQQETYNLNMMHFIVQHYAREHRIQYDVSWWAESLQKDLLSFDAFCKEYNVKPLAVEMVCAAPSLGYAGCIDLVCEMTVMEKGFADGVVYAKGKNEGQPKEVKIPKTFRAIVDFKSGKHQFYENNEIQANMYMNLWNTCYPEARVERCYNWRPTEWEGVDPTYNVKDQTRVNSSEKIPHLLKLFAIDVPPAPKPQLQMTGTIKLNAQFDGVIRRKPAEEIALERYESYGIARAVAGANIDKGQFVGNQERPLATVKPARPQVDENPETIIKSQGIHIHRGSPNSSESTKVLKHISEALAAPVAPIISESARAAKPETIELVTPVHSAAAPENYITPDEMQRVINPPVPDQTREVAPPPQTVKPIKTFLRDDDDIADDGDSDIHDEVIVPAPEPTPAPVQRRAPSPSLDRIKAELANGKPVNGKLQTA